MFLQVSLGKYCSPKNSFFKTDDTMINFSMNSQNYLYTINYLKLVISHKIVYFHILFCCFFQVFLAVLICTIVTLGLTLFAFQTKIDFTMMGGVLFVAALILMIFGIITIFWHGKVITLVYASFGALLFSIYIIYDTQIMLGGKHKYAISPEEYIFAALNLYLDIINLFLYILTIIGASRD